MRTAIATKFVAWEVPSLENLQGSKVYGLRTKLNNGEKLSREEKDWLTRNVNSNTYFKSAVPLQGWMFDFSDIHCKAVWTLGGIQGYRQDRTPQFPIRQDRQHRGT